MRPNWYCLDWRAQADAAKRAVDAAGDEIRADVINKYSYIWSNLKDAYGETSEDKCWYCETIRNRDDFAIDHYCPKGAVFGVPEHKGYYWLCFKPNNLMFSCRYCNERRRDKERSFTGGKGSFFPLGEKGVRAFAETDELEDERPILLAPTEVSDPTLIGCRFDGEVFPTSDKQAAPEDFKRGEVSINLYHLNHSRLAKARAQICAQLKELLDRTDAWFRRYMRAELAGKVELANQARLSYKENLNMIARMGDRAKPYAGAVRSLIKQEIADGREWLSCIIWA